MKIAICIPSYIRVTSLNNALSCIVGMGRDERVAEVLVGITGDARNSMNFNTNHLVRSLELLGKKVYIKDGFTGLISAKAWFQKQAKSPVLLLLDDDVVIPRDYLDLTKHFNSNKIFAVSGSLQTPLNIGHYKDYAYNKIKAPEGNTCNKVCYNSQTGKIEVRDKYQVYMLNKDKVYSGECLVGSAMFVRRKWFAEDLKLENGANIYDEIDFTYNQHLKGKLNLFDSSRVAFHNRENFGGAREFMNEKRKEDKNAKYFLSKYKNLINQ